MSVRSGTESGPTSCVLLGQSIGSIGRMRRMGRIGCFPSCYPCKLRGGGRLRVSTSSPSSNLPCRLRSWRSFRSSFLSLKLRDAGVPWKTMQGTRGASSRLSSQAPFPERKEKLAVAFASKLSKRRRRRWREKVIAEDERSPDFAAE